MRSSWPYRIVGIALLIGLIAVDMLAKLGPLGSWSTAFYIGANLILIAAFIVCVVAGERKDRARDVTESDNYY